MSATGPGGINAASPRDPDHLDPSIYRYILRHTRRDQVVLVLLTVASMPLVYLSLEVPKIIVNDALSAQFEIFPVLGMELTRVQYLLLMSFVFLILILVNGGIKYVTNVYSGVIGERMLRRFRYTLFSRLMRFPMKRFSDLSPGEVIPMVTAETEPLGGFIGDSVALPVFQGGLLITYVSFIFAQDFWLGLAAIALYPPQAIIIPRLQRRINALGRERVQTMRKVADRVGETVSAAADIRVNATAALERADLGDRLGKVFRIREEIFRRKFMVKFLSNFIGHLTPFFFYSIGGYLVIQGELSLGALVAVLAAYKDIGPPWRELLRFYQTNADVRIKYAQIIDQFQSDALLPDTASGDTALEPVPFGQGIEASNVRVAVTDHGNRLENASFSIGLDERVGVMTADAEAARQFALLAAGLQPPSSGRLQINGVDPVTLPGLDRGRNIGLCNADSFLFNSSIRDNLYYGMKQQPVEAGEDSAMDPVMLSEAIRSGNSRDPVDAEWCDPAVAGVADGDALLDWTRQVVVAVNLEDELMALALGSSLPPEESELRQRIVEMRDAVTVALHEIEGEHVVEHFAHDRFCNSLSVAENLLFGTPVDPDRSLEALLTQPELIRILQKAGLYGELVRIGSSLTDLMLELFSGVDATSDLFTRYSFIDANSLESYRALSVQIRRHGLEHCDEREQAMLVSMALKLCPDKHRLNLVSDDLAQRIVGVRGELEAALRTGSEQVLFIDRERYHSGFTMRANMIFGMVRFNRRHLMPAINRRLISVFEAFGLSRELLKVGLGAPCGIRGGNLTRVFRQKLLLARAIVKNPDILVVDNALSALDRVSQQEIITRVTGLRAGRNLVWTFSEAEFAALFDRVLEIHDGQVRSPVD